jgi:6,7-dimethyl-8-ribityllumazine synthase
MSNFVPPRARPADSNRRFAIVASQFNEEFVEGLVTHASNELRALSPSATVVLYHVPGAFEIPVVVRELASQQKADAILALGVIIRGHTAHAEHLARSVTDALQRIAIEYGIPVINAVLSLENEEQARERCLGGRINRGKEAARAAVEIADLMANLRSS